MILRDYQTDAINGLYAYWKDQQGQCPLLVLPTGSGKSVIIAQVVSDLMAVKQDAKCVMLTHTKELISQNRERLIEVDPSLDLKCGIACAGIQKRKDWDHPIVFGSRDTCGKHAEKLGRVDLLIIDEAHLVGRNEEGHYRNIIDRLRAANPKLRILGLTATPFRLDGSLFGDDEADIFDGVAYEIPVDRLIAAGHLVSFNMFASKHPIKLDGIRTTAGEYNQKDLAQRAMAMSYHYVEEVLFHLGMRNHCLIFTTGVDHAKQVRDDIRKAMPNEEQREQVAYLTGEHSKEERAQILADFKSGKIRILSSVGILTTGFDFPALDFIVLMFATKSTVKYVQCCGRGMRIADGKQDCLLLDYGSNVETHGTLTNLIVQQGSPVKPKQCPACGAMQEDLGAKECWSCGTPFEHTKLWKTCPTEYGGCNLVQKAANRTCTRCGFNFSALKLSASGALPKLTDTTGQMEEWLAVEYIKVKFHVAASSGNEMVRVECKANGETAYSYVNFDNPRSKHMNRALLLAMGWDADSNRDALEEFPKTIQPSHITIKRDGKWRNIGKVNAGVLPVPPEAVEDSPELRKRTQEVATRVQADEWMEKMGTREQDLEYF